MKAVLQRAAAASVAVGGEVVGSIGQGIVVLLGVEQGDGPGEVEWMVRKIAEIRMFEDDAGKMNRSVEETGGGVLVVSQFTLCADCRKGRRPSFVKAAEPDLAEKLYEDCADGLRRRGLPVETGKFAAMMDVSLVNAGPVTFLLESPKDASEEGGP
ncbi:MAG: D-aminoacyl-tRNA deacylase [Planctomycetota bacterium]